MEDGAGSRAGAVTLCFVKNDEPDCSEGVFLAKYGPEHGVIRGQRPFYELFGADVVYSGTGETLPLLRIKTCSTRGANGNCEVSTFLLAYEPQADKFRMIFFNAMGRNNNQEARFIESGPLQGRVIVAYPTPNAPFTYYIEVLQRRATGDYEQVLKYRGTTGYGDGNQLAVIDSQMPETLRRLGLWKVGDPLPMPPRMPRGCVRVVMRKGLEWCEAR